ncbi:hypothetical protein CPB85DRAFT_1429982 [Mucidula mucida]|nr:hypothetical protein CPB85DRAFT_1429982 [Mucidula mucida]
MSTTTAESVYEDDKADYAKQCRVADTTKFLKKLLPVPDRIIETVLEKLTGSHYDGKRWKDFPYGDTAVKGKALYAPFIKVANAIRSAIKEAAEATNDLHDVAEWVEYDSQMPEPSHSDAARPDCLLAHNVSKFAAKNWPTDDGQPDAKEKAGDTEEESITGVNIFTASVICAVEMKRKDSQKVTDIVKQLIGHLRRILSEQLDRRFVFGLTIGPKHMTVWLHDRSGVLGTSESFDIHQDPHSFIRVIGAFSVLPAEQLGFDTQMKEKQWVITTNGNEQYLTVKALSISRARVMHGPASLVWAVVAFKDGQVTSKKILVLKQCWRPVGSKSEQEMLLKVKNAAADMTDTSGEDFVVHVQLEETITMSGKEDITGSLIRKGLQVSASKRTLDAAERYLRVNMTDDDIISIVAVTSSRPTSRIHTRLLLSTFGWPLKNFKTRREAVRGIRDAVVGHEYVYYNGLLHQDISPGNIVLAWCDEDVVWTHVSTFAQGGQTIDFSILKWTKVLQLFSFKLTEEERRSDSRTGTPPYTSGEILSRERYYIDPDLFHDAVHDMESFFWVLIHICLTRSGPDAQQRAELDGDNKDHQQLRFIVHCFFSCNEDDLAFNKRKLFKAPDDFEKVIIPHFHPYFDELKPFMREWFSLLVLAYDYLEGYEYHNIHRRVLDILDRALASMTLEERDSDAGRKAVIESRRDSLCKLTEIREGHKYWQVL